MLLNLDQDPHKSDNVAPNKIVNDFILADPTGSNSGKGKRIAFIE